MGFFNRIIFIGRLVFSFDVWFAFAIFAFVTFLSLLIGSFDHRFGLGISYTLFLYFLYRIINYMYKKNPTLKSSLPLLPATLPKIIYGLLFLPTFYFMLESNSISEFWANFIFSIYFGINFYLCFKPVNFVRTLPYLLCSFALIWISWELIDNDGDISVGGEAMAAGTTAAAATSIAEEALSSVDPSDVANTMDAPYFDPNPPTIEVEGYERADGTWVRGHERTMPDDYISNNLSERIN